MRWIFLLARYLNLPTEGLPTAFPRLPTTDATSAGSSPTIPQPVPVDGAAQQNGNVESQSTLHTGFSSTHSQGRSIHRSDNNQSTPQMQGDEDCQVDRTPPAAIELNIDDANWDLLMELIDNLPSSETCLI
ncbi:hypothetical protein MTO96_041370 [Rhipicephalus appendiculatus]